MALTTLVLLAAGGGVIGFLLAVLGAGGSILLMPLLTIGAGLKTDTAIAISLLVVIALAIGNSIPSVWRRQIAIKPAVVLGLPALAGSWIGGTLAKHDVITDVHQLAVFAVVAAVVAWLMLRTPAKNAEPLPLKRALMQPRADWPLAVQGLLVGLLTGIAGVGGGFAIVPALVLLAGLPMQIATSTSLVLIALNSLVALKALGVWPAQQLPLLLPLLVGGAIGAVVGQWLSPHLNEWQLRRGFAAVLIGSSVLIAGKALDTHRSSSKAVAEPSFRRSHHDVRQISRSPGDRQHRPIV